MKFYQRKVVVDHFKNSEPFELGMDFFKTEYLLGE
jgi:hypothetical protein